MLLHRQLPPSPTPHDPVMVRLQPAELFQQSSILLSPRTRRPSDPAIIPTRRDVNIGPASGWGMRRGPRGSSDISCRRFREDRCRFSQTITLHTHPRQLSAQMGQFLVPRSASALKRLRRLPTQLPTSLPQDIRPHPRAAAS